MDSLIGKNSAPNIESTSSKLVEMAENVFGDQENTKKTDDESDAVRLQKQDEFAELLSGKILEKWQMKIQESLVE